MYEYFSRFLNTLDIDFFFVIVKIQQIEKKILHQCRATLAFYSKF